MNSKSILLFGSVFVSVFVAILYIFIGLNEDHPIRQALSQLVSSEPAPSPVVKRPSVKAEANAHDSSKGSAKGKPKPKDGEKEKEGPVGPRPVAGSRRDTQRRTIWTNNLQDALAALRKGNLQEAEKGFQDRLKEIEEFDPTIDKDVAEDHIVVLTNLAETSRRLNKEQPRELYFRRALEVARESAVKEDPIRMSQVFANLASALFDQQKYKESEQMCRQAVELQAKHLDPNDPELGIVVGLLGRIFVMQKKYDEAESRLVRCLAIARANRKDLPAEFCQSLLNLAAVYHLMGQTAKEEPLLREAVDAGGSLPADHPQQLENLSQLALYFKRVNKNAEAEPLLQKVIVIHESSPKRDGEVISHYQIDLAGVELELGKTDEAEKLLTKAMDVQSLIYQDATNPKLLPALGVQLKLFQKTKRPAEAAATEAKIKRIRDAIEEKRKEKEAAEKAEGAKAGEESKPDEGKDSKK